jgi:hypothetical protein
MNLLLLARNHLVVAGIFIVIAMAVLCNSLLGLVGKENDDHTLDS